MRLNYRYLIPTLVLFFPGCMQPSEKNVEADKIITKIWLIGVSTVADYSKSKDYISKKYPKSTRSFFQEGRWRLVYDFVADIEGAVDFIYGWPTAVSIRSRAIHDRKYSGRLG